MRFGLLGTGPWAEMVHGPGLVAHDGVELVGVWGRHRERTRALAERLGTEAYEEAEQLFSDVEAIACCLPPAVQAELALEAARAGCHLLLEKPLALTTEAAEALDQAVDQAGVFSLIFYTALYDPGLEAFFSELGDGSFITADIVMLGTIFDGTSPFGDSPWRKEKGALWDIGPHSLSWASAALGLPRQTSARYGVGDLVHLAVTHQSGATSSHLLSLTAPAEAECTKATFFGESGVFEMPARTESSLAAFGVALGELMAAVETGRPHPLGTQHGVAIVRALEQAERTAV